MSTQKSDDPSTVLLFDGVCNLCNGFVQAIIPRDPDGRISFASLQSDYGQTTLSRHGLPTEELESVVLVEGDRVYRKSTAVIRVAELLGWPYKLATVGRVVPTAVADALYDFVADHRYEWFGRKDRCMVPDADVSDRFVGGDAGWTGPADGSGS